MSELHLKGHRVYASFSTLSTQSGFNSIVSLDGTSVMVTSISFFQNFAMSIERCKLNSLIFSIKELWCYVTIKTAPSLLSQWKLIFEVHGFFFSFFQSTQQRKMTICFDLQGLLVPEAFVSTCWVISHVQRWKLQWLALIALIFFFLYHWLSRR